MNSKEIVKDLLEDASTIAQLTAGDLSEQLTTECDEQLHRSSILGDHLRRSFREFMLSEFEVEPDPEEIVDTLAHLFCSVAHHLSANNKTYWEGTREIFEENLHMCRDWETDPEIDPRS